MNFGTIRETSIIPTDEIPFGHSRIPVQLQGQPEKIAGQKIGEVHQTVRDLMSLMHMPVQKAHQLLPLHPKHMSQSGCLAAAGQHEAIHLSRRFLHQLPGTLRQLPDFFRTDGKKVRKVGLA